MRQERLESQKHMLSGLSEEENINIITQTSTELHRVNNNYQIKALPWI